MGSGVVIEGESAGDILLQERNLLDVGNQSIVDHSLGSLALSDALRLLFLLVVGELASTGLEGTLGSLALGLQLSEVLVSDSVSANTGQGHSLGGHQHVGGVDSLEGYSIEFVWASD